MKGIKALVLGLGISGRSAASFLLKRGANVTGADRNADQLGAHAEIADLMGKGMALIPDVQPVDFQKMDMLVVSPGVSPQHHYFLRAVEAGTEILGEAELACRAIQKPCLAVTGTNGKTTVSMLAAHALNYSGIKAKAIGNIGIPLTSVLEQTGEEEIYVVELSSFQLDTLQSKFVDAGVILNITPDHLDRYADMEAYARSKIQLSNLLKPSGKLFIERGCAEEFAKLLAGKIFSTYGFQPDCSIRSDLENVYAENEQAFSLPMQLRRKANHDHENAMAAYALCREFGLSGSKFLAALNAFKKPPHRIEFVDTISGVHFYDDSKGTNVDAVIRAVDSLEGSVVLIAGGVDKGAPYTPWIEVFSGKVKLVCAIGEAAEKMKRDLGHRIPVQIFGTLDEAVRHAACAAAGEGIVLLSPGCSSYDMFRDYAHRGEEFQRLVRALKRSLC